MGAKLVNAEHYKNNSMYHIEKSDIIDLVHIDLHFPFQNISNIAKMTYINL